MRYEDLRTTGEGLPSQGASNRYQSALAYVELDRAHRKRSRWSTVLAVSVIVLVASLVMLGVIWSSYLQGQMKNNRIAENADLVGIDKEFAEENIRIDWDALLAVNPDTVAWLYIPGTAINYPVVRGEDNDYYLSHDFTGDQAWLASFGAIFLDWRNNPDWTDQAYFIYGHHMNDGSMFADIAGLSDQARFDASRKVYLLSPNGNFKLRTFSLIHCASDDPLVQISFSNAEDMSSYIQDKVNRSIVYANDVPSASEITKSFAFATCDNYSSGRYVLYAYVEQAIGLDAAAAATGSSGGAAGRVNDLPADDLPRSAQGGYQADYEYDDYSYGYVEDDEDAADEADVADNAGDGSQPESQRVSVGDYEEYAGGYYTYDEDGNLLWVSTED